MTDLSKVKRKMYAANNVGINILGAIFVRLTGYDNNGTKHDSAEMLYESDSTNKFYLSRHAMVQLKIIDSEFPKVGAKVNSVSVKNDQMSLFRTSVSSPKAR